MLSANRMAKKRQLPEKGSTPQFHATVEYKKWVRAMLDEKGISFAKLAAAIKRHDPSLTASSASVSLFLGREGEEPRPSNTSWMPAINKFLGAAPPPVCDPSDEFEQLVDRLRSRWKKMNARERRMLLAMASDDIEIDTET